MEPDKRIFLTNQSEPTGQDRAFRASQFKPFSDFLDCESVYHTRISVFSAVSCRSQPVSLTCQTPNIGQQGAPNRGLADVIQFGQCFFELARTSTTCSSGIQLRMQIETLSGEPPTYRKILIEHVGAVHCRPNFRWGTVSRGPLKIVNRAVTVTELE